MRIRDVTVSYIYYFLQMLTVLLEDGPAGPKHVGQCSKLVCPKFILLRVMCWPFNKVRFV